MHAAAAAAKSLQSCPTLCNPIDGSSPGSPVPGILHARTLEWVVISFSNAWKWKVKVKSLSHVRLLVTPWTAAYQALPSMGFSRQEYWSGLPLPSLGGGGGCVHPHTKVGGMPKIGRVDAGEWNFCPSTLHKEKLTKSLVNGFELGFSLVVRGCAMLTAHQLLVEWGRKLTFAEHLLCTRDWGWGIYILCHLI